MKTKESKNTIYKKITLLNQTVFDSMLERNNTAIIKKFTETGIKILEADFGFAWWKFGGNEEYKLAYKSPSTPYNPTYPREKAGNYIAQKTQKPFFDSNIKKENYEFKINQYLHSYIIIPIFHGNNIYGNLVICYKKTHKFTDDELTLAQTIGNTAAQAITVHRLVGTDVLLDQEKVKTQFIANATHELRTPLAIMRGNVDLALRDKNLKSATGALKIVQDEIVHLTAILSDLATLTSHIGNNRKEAPSDEIDIIALIDLVAQRLAVLLSRKDIKLGISSGKIRKLFIQGERKALEKLFVNLIRNAITYGKEGGHILIGIKKVKNEIVVTVEDDGMGISKEDLPYVFERFYRAEKAREMSSIGTGLGLAIAKWAAESHDGTITVKSIEGKGSVFTVTLPIKK